MKLQSLWWQTFGPNLLLQRALKAIHGPAQCVLVLRAGGLSRTAAMTYEPPGFGSHTNIPLQLWPRSNH